MASSAVEPDDILGSSPEKNNYTRLTRLLVSGGGFIMREYFDTIFPPTNLSSVLKDPHVYNKLQWMKKKKILNFPQWQHIFPSNTTCGKSESFDISLMFKLIREFSTLTAPPEGWDELPDDGDLTLPADLARIKYYRNVVYAHENEKMELSDSEFEDLWQRIKDALLRIVKHYSLNNNPSQAVSKWEKAIKSLKTDPLETEEAQRNKDELQTWCSDDPAKIWKTLSELKAEQEELKTRIKKLEDAHPVVNIQCSWRYRMQGLVVGSATTFFILHYKDDPTSLINLVNGALPVGLLVQSIVAGSIVLQLRATRVEALDELSKRYQSGQLKEDLEKVFMTEEFMTLLDGEKVEFSVGICEEEIEDARRALISAREKATGEEAAKEEGLAQALQETKLTTDFQIFDGDIFEDGKNKFQARFAVITSKNQVEQVLAELKKKDPDVSKATHNIWAYRISDAKRGPIENCHDDGDDTAGAKVLYFLKRTEAMDVMVVVSCWYETTADDLGDVRFKYIQKSVLDLLLMHRIVEIPKSKLKKFFEEIKYTPFEKMKEQEVPKFEIIHGEPIKDRGSTFQGHLADITSRDHVDQVLAELKKDRKIAKATYNMWACRIYDEKTKSYLEEGNDDGEDFAGERLVHLLRISDAKNVVVIVTRWHGGIHLGNNRFKHINKCAVDLLQFRGNIRCKRSHLKVRSATKSLAN